MQDDPETEARLEEAARGDEPALRWLLERHRARLRRMIGGRLDPRILARLDPSDVVQETLTQAVFKLSEYVRDRPLPFYPWLHRLAVEQVIQVHRHHRGAACRDAGRECVKGAGDSGSIHGLAEALLTGESSPSGRLIREEERLGLVEALELLPEPDQELLRMRYLDGLDFGEIAAVLIITAQAARVRHFRALKRLALLLKPIAEALPP